jgi:hypothetical protein
MGPDRLCLDAGAITKLPVEPYPAPLSPGGVFFPPKESDRQEILNIQHRNTRKKHIDTGDKNMNKKWLIGMSLALVAFFGVLARQKAITPYL